MTIETERLKAFMAVAREKNFTRAAEKLYRTQPAISQSIKLLEGDLGEPLFLRLGRSATLTEAGRILFEHVTEAFEALEQGRNRIESLKELREGKLTISASDTTSCYILPSILRQFHDRYPRIELRIFNRPSPEATKQVAARESDIGIVTLPVRHPRLVTVPIIIREDVVICAPSHSLSTRARVCFSDLKPFPLLLLDHGSNTRNFIDEKLRASGLDPNILMELGSIEVIKKMVQMGFGVSIVPKISIQEEEKAGVLQSIRIFDRSECRQLGFVFQKSGVLPLAAQVFMKILRETLHGVEML